MGGIKDWKFGPPHETKAMRRFLRKTGGKLTENAMERIGIGEFAHGIGKEQRNWADLKTRPIERALSQIIRNRISGDQSAMAANAQRTVEESYDKSAGETSRNAARFGVRVDPATDTGFGLDRTKSAIQAGNLVTQTDRDQALRDAQQFYQNGAGLPGMATQEYIAGAGSLADQNDYMTGMDVGAGLGAVEAQHQLGQSFENMADGGEVGGIDPTMGGRPGTTIGLRRKYSDYYADKAASGEEPRDWPGWLADNGYALEKDNLVNPKYAAGGIIEGEAERVDLNTGDFIVPDHAVEFYGREFWDKLVAENGGEIGDIEVGEEDDEVEPEKAGAPGYAGGGEIGFSTGIEEGYARGIGPMVGAVKEGLTKGLLGAQQTEDRAQQMADRAEDRTYLREDRAYQGKQRQQADIKQAYERDIDEATAQFVASDGKDLSAIIGVQKKYSKGRVGNITTTQNPDGTLSLTAFGPDGKQTSQPQVVSQDELRSMGMNMIEAMRDPKALIKSWNEKPTTVSTADGATTQAWNPRTRKWEQIASNPKDPKANTEKYNPLSNAKEIARLIGERLGGKYDDITGKMIKPPDDPELATALIAAAHEFERQNPGKLLPGEVVKNVFDQVVEVPREEDVRKKVRKEISDKTGYFSTDEADLGMPRREYEDKRVKELTGGGFGLGKPAAPRAPAAQGNYKPTYKAPNGRAVALQDIMDTARKHRQTPEQVIQNLGLQ